MTDSLKKLAEEMRADDWGRVRQELVTKWADRLSAIREKLLKATRRTEGIYPQFTKLLREIAGEMKE